MEENNYSYEMALAFDNVLLNSLVGADQATNIRQSRVTLTLKTEYTGPYSRNWSFLSAWARSSYGGNRPYLPMPFKPDMLTVMSMLIEGTKSHWIVQENILLYRAWAKAQRAIVVMSGNIYGGTLYLQKYREPYEIWTKRYYNNFLELEAVHLVPCIPGRVMGVAVDAGVATIDIEYDFDKIVGEFEINPYPADSPDDVHDQYWVQQPTTLMEKVNKRIMEVPELPREPELPCDTGSKFRLFDDDFTTLWNTPITINKQDLLANDLIDGFPMVVEILDVKNGYITEKGKMSRTVMGDEFVFVPTGTLGQNGSFRYKVINENGRESINTALVTILVRAPLLEPVDDVFSVLEKNDTLKITFDELTQNDKHTNPIKNIKINSSKGIYLTRKGNEFYLTPTVPAYGEAWFKYSLVDSTGYESPSQATVTINITKPKINLHNDTFHVPFHGSVLIPAAVLTSNDESDFPLVQLVIDQMQNGTVEFVGQNIKFTHTGPKNEPAWFSYKAIDEYGYEAPTAALVTAIVDPPAITAVNDNFQCLQGSYLAISLAKLYANDIHDNAIAKAVFSGLVGCTLTDNGNSITVTPTVTAGEPCWFEYRITDIYGFESENTARVTIDVYKPLLEPVADNYSVVQRQKLSVTFADLWKNDKHENAISRMEIVDTKNCQVSLTSTGVTITPSAIYGEDCWFTYRIIDDKGHISDDAAKVTITIQHLPDVSANIYTTAQIEQMFANNYKPPTLQEIFGTWARYYNKYYYGPGTTPQGEAASWQMHTAKNFRCTVNSSYLTGFVSPDKFDTYVHEADLSSTDSDDDGIYLIIAFKRIGGVNHSLMLMRCSTGCWISGKPSNCFGIVYVKDNTPTLIKNASGTKCRQTGGWNKFSPCRVRVTRIGDKITCESAVPKSTNIASGEKIEIDLKNYSNLAWAREKLPYGYACWSQRYSSFDNVTFEASAKIDMDVIYNGENGDVWRFQNNQWVKTGEKVWDIFDYPRNIENPLTDEKFVTGNNTVGKA